MAPPPDGPDMNVAATDPMVPQLARVRARRRDAPDVFTLDVELEKPAETVPFVPGQFNMLTVFGVGEVPISFSGDPAKADRAIHTIRAVGPVSKALIELRPGEALGLRGPFGRGWPMAEAAGQDVVIVAGGLGLAPLRPAIYRLLAEREHYGRIVLLYGSRSPEDIVYLRELQSWRRRMDIDVEVTVDHAVSAWHSHIGVVTRLIPRASFDPLHSIAFVCGPEMMMRFAIAALTDAGIADTAIFLSMERNMKCAVGFCGHCQYSPVFVCRDGPVFRYDRVRGLLTVKEL